jgi:hypothetical protein
LKRLRRQNSPAVEQSRSASQSSARSRRGEALDFAVDLAYGISMMRGYFEDVPTNLEESALIDGCTRWQALTKVILPVARNSIFALVLIRTEAMPFTVQLSGYSGAQSTIWAKISGMSMLGTLPISLAVATMQRYLVRGISLGAIKGYSWATNEREVLALLPWTCLMLRDRHHGAGCIALD